MLPKIDGLEICRKLSDGIKTPILILTAKTTLDDKVAGLNSGADDYLTKPFAFLEFSARVAALIQKEPESAISATYGGRSGPRPNQAFSEEVEGK